MTCHAVGAIEEAFCQFGTPDIVNTDQGSQFTATDFTNTIQARGCDVSMDGRGAWRDNVFVERLWQTIKYECVYLYAYETVNDARKSITEFITWYNHSRPHSSLALQTPSEAYTAMLPAGKLAA